MTLPTLLSYWSGLAFVRPELGFPELVGTMFVLHICDAVMCRLFARNNGYPRNAWTLIGFVGGIWAVAILILLPRRPAVTSDSSTRV